MDMLVLTVSLFALSVLVGYLVKLALDRNAEIQAQISGTSSDAEALLKKAATESGSGMPGFLARMVAGKRAMTIRKELPDALDMIANSLSAGLTLPQAILRNLDHFPPAAAEEFARIIYDTRLGYSVAEAFSNFSQRVPTADARMISIASEIGVAHGGNLAESYRMLSALLRDNISFEAELKAMTTEGRMQALVMSCLPFALMLILGLVNPTFIVPMVTTAAGWGVIVGLLIMLSIAYFWIRKIVDIKV